ncbi:phage regulatory protein/antirepressor Ant [Vibrio fluvialis]|nr:phage regulatory protein/antirepressor Ant [Vibrio fluvialis]EKO3461201.1 phage regulatory protein/antirepressor Ant [Vibrio fluvialis]
MHITTRDQNLTMNSREIAELTGKRHDHVLTDIRNMLVEIQSPEKSGEYKDGRGRNQPMLLLDKEETLCLVAGYNIKLRMAIIKRWRELEESNQFKVPQTLPEALLLAAELAKQNEETQRQLAIAAPKADFADRIASADKGVPLGNFAKSVGIGPRKIFVILRDVKILMSGGERHNLPFQEFIDRGYFQVKQGSYEANGETRISHTPLITGKGEQWLTKKLIDCGILKATAA